MANEKIKQFKGSLNYVTDLNRSFNSATSLVQTVSTSQSVNTGGDSGSASANTNSSSSQSGSGTSDKK